MKGCYSPVPPPPGLPILSWVGLWPLLRPGSCLPLPEKVIAMFAAPFLVWKDLEAGEAGDKVGLTGCDQSLSAPEESLGRLAGGLRRLLLASVFLALRPALWDLVLASSPRARKPSTAARPLQRSPGSLSLPPTQP